jgi:tRNA threonylcarbamoyl adenosine modification protein YeaZ
MAEKIILGLCTSGSRLKAAVYDGKEFLGAQKKVFNQELELFPMVKRLLAAAGADLRGIAAVCAVRGPGRFTGIRISLTLAASLKAMAGAAVHTATLFEILALQAAESRDFKKWSPSGGRLAVLVHAFKDEYFCQFFAAAPGARPAPEGEPVWLKAEEAKKLLAVGGGPLYAVADAEEDPGVYALVPPSAARAPASISRIVPAYIIKAALAYKNHSLKPLYLKPAKYETENNISYGPGRRLKK